MRTRLEEHDDDGMSEILSRALRKESEGAGSRLDHLLAAADELGISHEAVKEAELEYRVESERKRELKEFRAVARKHFQTHLWSYVIVNVFLFAINLITYAEDREIWALYCVFGWGIGIAIHGMCALKNPDWNDPEFQKWRRARAQSEDNSRLLES